MSISQSASNFEQAKTQAAAKFNAFRKAYRDAVERARDHGNALIALTAECSKAGRGFLTTLDELGIPRSTAYEHRKLASIWPEYQAVIQSGVDAAKTIPEIIRLVDPSWKLPKDAQAGPKTGSGHQDADSTNTPAASTSVLPGGTGQGASTSTLPPTDSVGTPPSQPSVATTTADPDHPTTLDREAAKRFTLEQIVANFGRIGSAIRVKRGTAVRVGKASVKVNGPVLLVPEG